jgi:hypothetical protein
MAAFLLAGSGVGRLRGSREPGRRAIVWHALVPATAQPPTPQGAGRRGLYLRGSPSPAGVQASAWRLCGVLMVLTCVAAVAVVWLALWARYGWREPWGKHACLVTAVQPHDSGLAIRITRSSAASGRPLTPAGILVLDVPGDSPHLPGRAWSAPGLEVSAPALVHARVDGEAVDLRPPLKFTTRPAALRVRISSRHPGASPSAPFAPAGSPRWGQTPAL